jgi:hypothetical protein
MASVFFIMRDLTEGDIRGSRSSIQEIGQASKE